MDSILQVVQVYVSWSNHSVPVPKLQLVGFKRVRIAAGQTTALMFTVVPEQLRVWMDDTTGWGHLAGIQTIAYSGLLCTCMWMGCKFALLFTQDSYVATCTCTPAVNSAHNVAITAVFCIVTDVVK